MRPLENWNNIEAWGNGNGGNYLEPGWQKCQLLQVTTGKNRFDDEVVTFYFDIVDGPFAGYFRKDRNAQTSVEKVWRGTLEQAYTTETGAKFFKGLIMAIEESNPGYKWNWDEGTLKGKMVGVGFRKEWYEDKITGQDKYTVRAFTFRDVSKIAELEPPKDKPKKGTSGGQGYASPNLTPPGYQSPAGNAPKSAPNWEPLEDDEPLPF